MDWENSKKYQLGVAGVMLMCISGVNFTFGLSLNDKTGWMFWVGLMLWVSSTIVQIAGASHFNKQDIVFKIIVVASYVLGVATGAYAWSKILPFGDGVLGWVAYLSLSSLIEFAPERLLNMAFGKEKKLVQPEIRKDDKWKPVEQKHIGPKKETYRPQSRPVSLGEPTYKGTEFPWAGK